MPMIRKEPKKCSDCSVAFEAPVYVKPDSGTEYGPKRCPSCIYAFRNRRTGGHRGTRPGTPRARRAGRQLERQESAHPIPAGRSDALKPANPNGGKPPLGYVDPSGSYIPSDTPLGLLKTARDALAELDVWIGQVDAARREDAEQIAADARKITELEEKLRAIKAAVA